FPAALEEGVERQIAVGFRLFDMPGLVEAFGFVADGFPIVAKLEKLVKSFDIEDRLIGNLGEEIDERIIRGQERGMIAKLAHKAQLDLAAEVYVKRGNDVHAENDVSDPVKPVSHVLFSPSWTSLARSVGNRAI